MLVAHTETGTVKSEAEEEEGATGTLGFLFLDGLSPSLLRRKAGVKRADLRSEL